MVVIFRYSVPTPAEWNSTDYRDINYFYAELAERPLTVLPV